MRDRPARPVVGCHGGQRRQDRRSDDEPTAVSPDGDVVAVRDSRRTRDLLLIGTDRSVRELYSLPEPDLFYIDDIEIDDRWIVFAVVRHPRNANGVLPKMTRIELIDRRTGVRSTVVEQSAADAASRPERNVLDALALFDGRVYWITRDTYNSETGAAHSFDPLTGSRTDIASGAIRDIQSGPAGAAWSQPIAPPPADAGLTPAELASLGTDGTAFGWINDPARGGSGIGYWSPQTGVVRVNGLAAEVMKLGRPVLVFDALVILDHGGSTTNLKSSATIVDTRSGATVALTARVPGQYDRVVASRGGTLALALSAGKPRGSKQSDYTVGLLRNEELNPQACQVR